MTKLAKAQQIQKCKTQENLTEVLYLDFILGFYFRVFREFRGHLIFYRAFSTITTANTLSIK